MEAVLSLEELSARIPEPGKDIRLNLKFVLDNTSLTREQALGVALACAFNQKNHELVQVYRDMLQDPAIVQDAQSAAALMAMNNVFYRFRHMVGDSEYEALPARLRMQKLANPTNKINLELFSLAVSAINGCENCIKSHEQVLLGHGISKQNILDAVRIAATVRAADVALSL
ncbi:MAG: carboxymuconolactone decarboxylase family protein [Acidobacteria bacterium]|nr:carboxymuconolactone decarboxylase family protein [Acidobacteriota bacterium]MCB9398751.1 carboxymuconolactone decarboxylase family protein [Acidobacteriota bacterium]